VVTFPSSAIAGATAQTDATEAAPVNRMERSFPFDTILCDILIPLRIDAALRVLALFAAYRLKLEIANWAIPPKRAWTNSRRQNCCKKESERVRGSKIRSSAVTPIHWHASINIFVRPSSQIGEDAALIPYRNGPKRRIAWVQSANPMRGVAADAVNRRIFSRK
jgi:hypothetical protein